MGLTPTLRSTGRPASLRTAARRVLGRRVEIERARMRAFPVRHPVRVRRRAAPVHRLSARSHSAKRAAAEIGKPAPGATPNPILSRRRGARLNNPLAISVMMLKERCRCAPSLGKGTRAPPQNCARTSATFSPQPAGGEANRAICISVGRRAKAGKSGRHQMPAGDSRHARGTLLRRSCPSATWTHRNLQEESGVCWSTPSPDTQARRAEDTP